MMNDIEITNAKIFSRRLGDVPGGTRVDLQYEEGSIADDEGSIKLHGLQNGEGKLLTGRLLAGHDWALMRDDAVGVFEGKVTCQINVGGEARPNWMPALMTIQGRGDFCEAEFESRSSPLSQGDALAAWRNGYPFTLAVHVAATLLFDAGAPPELRALERGLYWGQGEYRFEDRDRVTISLTLTGASALFEEARGSKGKPLKGDIAESSLTGENLYPQANGVNQMAQPDAGSGK